MTPAFLAAEFSRTSTICVVPSRKSNPKGFALTITVYSDDRNDCLPPVEVPRLRVPTVEDRLAAKVPIVEDRLAAKSVCFFGR